MSTEQNFITDLKIKKKAVISILFHKNGSNDIQIFENYYASSLVMGDRLNTINKNDSKIVFDSIIIIDYKTYKVLNEYHKYEDLVKKFDKVVISDDNEGYFLKLDAWKLIKSYDKIIYLDLDCWLVTHESIQLIFDETSEEDSNAKIFACNETTWPDMFNTGVFAIKKETALDYSEMKEYEKHFKALKASNSEQVDLYDTFDQGLLNFSFADTWQKIPYIFNVQLRGGGNGSNSNFGITPYNQTYFTTNSTATSNHQSNGSNEDPGTYSSTYFSGDINTAGINPTSKKFLDKALIFQFMEKPWQNPNLEYIAPKYYSNFNSFKQDNIFTKETTTPDVSTLSLSENKDHVAETSETDKKEATISTKENKKEEENLFLFPWNKYQDFPKENQRIWK